MLQICYEVDFNGFIVSEYVLNVNEDNGIFIAFEGKEFITVSIKESFFKPKWNGTEWVEGATQEEIDELTKVEPSPPTEIEQLKERLIIAENTILDLILGGL